MANVDRDQLMTLGAESDPPHADFVATFVRAGVAREDAEALWRSLDIKDRNDEQAYGFLFGVEAVYELLKKGRR